MYTAIVCRLNGIRRHGNADRLQLCNLQGYQVVLGEDSKEGQLGCFCPSDGKLNPSFVAANDLAPRFDAEGKRAGGGFFDPPNFRLRSQKFRGERSDGYWFPIEYLENWAICLGNKEVVAAVNALKEGDQFSCLGGVELCSKYETQATKQAHAANKQKGLKKNSKNHLFLEHVETQQFRHQAHNIPVGSVVYISLKQHGTSARYTFMYDQPRLSFWELFTKKVSEKYGLKRNPVLGHRHIVGSRTVQIKDEKGGWYGSNAFRFKAFSSFKDALRPGETVYGELVGFTAPGKPIMAVHDTTKLKDKEVTKLYGNRMVYSYGCEDGECDFYVYRVTRSCETGHAIELSVSQVKARCEELGLKYVHELTGPLLMRTVDDLDWLRGLVESFSDGPDPLGKTHVREGVVVRVESPDGRTYFLKYKGFTFSVCEGLLLDTNTYIDEEGSS